MEERKRSDKYKVIKVLGEGAFGVVRLGKDIDNGRRVALKYIRSSGETISKAVFREVEALRQLAESDLIVELIEMFPDETNLCLVLEYVPLDLSDVIQFTVTYLPRNVLKSFSFMILSALSHCHSKKIIHRDIKPSNILFGLDGRLKLSDFGLARLLSEPSLSLSHQVATRFYRPPELLFGARRYSFSADIWSAGAVIGELMMLSPMFPGNNDIDQILRVMQVMGTPTSENWPTVEALPDYNKISFGVIPPMDLSMLFPASHLDDIHFLQRLLRLDPCQRITASQAIASDYFYCSPTMEDLKDTAYVIFSAKQQSQQNCASSQAQAKAMKNVAGIKGLLQEKIASIM